MSTFDETYDIRTFAPTLVDGKPDPLTASWIAATRIAFHQDHSDAAVLEGVTGAIADGRVFTGVYAKHPLPGSLDENWPVGTYTGYTKTINVGRGRLVDSYLISDVSVRPSHKRKGMLRRMMTDHLAAAAESGLALAALTASESTIYRRFGFGPATRRRAISIARDTPFDLQVAPLGRVELATAHELESAARAVFNEFHARTPGSVDRQQQLWKAKLGIATDDGSPDKKLRAAVHYAPESTTIDAYATYRMTEEGTDDVLQVVDLVAANANAFLGIWEFLGSVDLVDRIRYSEAAVDSTLLHALVNSRSLETHQERDHIWLRILDPLAALSARSYSLDTTLTLRVHDRLGYCEGTFRVEARSGETHVARLDDTAAADLELDAATLATLYLGGVSVQLLHEAGLVAEWTPHAVATATALFAPDRPVVSITDF